MITKQSLKNIFNWRALAMGALTAAGVFIGFEIGFALEHFPNGGHIAAGQHIFAGIAGGLAGFWNAHTVGNQSIVKQSKALTVARNLGFMATSSLAPAIGLGMLFGSVAPGVGVGLGLAIGAALNASWLKWEPTPQPKTEEFQHKEPHFAEAIRRQTEALKQQQQKSHLKNKYFLKYLFQPLYPALRGDL